MSRKAKKTVKAEKDHSHSSHPKTLSRLKIASGHLLKVIEMVEADEECIDVLQQLAAVISALESSRITLLQDHFTSCVAPALSEDSKYLIKDLETLLQRALK